MEKLVGTYMIKGPYLGDPETSPQDALDLLVECGIRHLPIVDDGKLVGLVSERDLRSVMSLPQVSQLSVGDVMKRDVFVAKRSTPLIEIIRQMQQRKLGSTVIINDSEEVVGKYLYR
jgi:acetoin utilization protein AcuB